MSTSTAIDKLDPNFAQRDPQAGLHWYDIATLPIEGKGFGEVESFYDRLPARTKDAVPEQVWRLSQYSAGMCVRFVSDARNIAVRWTVRFERLAMPHMPATGVSGLDLYAKVNGQWVFAGSARPSEFPDNQYQLVQSMVPVTGGREFRMYLPLYNGVSKVEIGIEENATLFKPPAYADPRPMLFYGTSIVHGGCASRPGMNYSAILGRRFNRPIINLGFSGNGKAEIEVAQLLAELDPCVYVIDTLGNMNMEQIAERIDPFVRTLRTARPTTPIILVEHHRYGGESLIKWKVDTFVAMQKLLHEIVIRLRNDGIENLHVLTGDLVGHDSEGTVDGTHPTDLGFMRMADIHEPILRTVLS